MWILPSQLLNSVQDMEVLDLASKTSLASECGLSHIVSLRGLLKQISSVKWKKDSWMSHLFGTILKPSHTNRFTDWWTSSLRDTLANPSLRQESGQAKTIPDISGLGSQTEFDFFDQECVSLKMSKATSVWASEKSLEIWNQLVIKRRGEYSARLKLVRPTKGRESLSWPTSSARDYKDSPGMNMGTHKGRDRSTNQLPRMVYSIEASGQADQASLNTTGNHQESWRTPSSSDGVGGVMEMREGCAGKFKLRDHVVAQQNPGKLNPRWVETLMGLPVGWVMPSCQSPVTIAQTSCDYSEMESCQRQQRELFEF